MFSSRVCLRDKLVALKGRVGAFPHCFIVNIGCLMDIPSYSKFDIYILFLKSPVPYSLFFFELMVVLGKLNTRHN